MGPMTLARASTYRKDGDVPNPRLDLHCHPKEAVVIPCVTERNSVPPAGLAPAPCS